MIDSCNVHRPKANQWDALFLKRCKNNLPQHAVCHRGLCFCIQYFCNKIILLHMHSFLASAFACHAKPHQLIHSINVIHFDANCILKLLARLVCPECPAADCRLQYAAAHALFFYHARQVHQIRWCPYNPCHMKLANRGHQILFLVSGHWNCCCAKLLYSGEQSQPFCPVLRLVCDLNHIVFV